MYKKVEYDKRHDKYKSERNASIYEAWIRLNGKTGRASYTGASSFLAEKLGVSRQRIEAIVKQEQKRRNEAGVMNSGR